MNRWLNRPVSFGLHLSFLSPDLVEFCGLLGFQWLFLDAQRTPVTPATCRDLVRAADLTGLFCVARVSHLDTAEIEGFLDAGVLGILAPSIETAAQAEALVAAVKFPVRGRRGAASRSRAASYGLPQEDPAARFSKYSHLRYYQEANEATFTAALIETPCGLEHLEEIAAVPDLDYVALGRNDLALALGGNSAADPHVQSLIDSASQRLQATGKPQITVVTDCKSGQEAVARGARLIAVSDAALINLSGSRFLDSLGSYVANSP
jgi:4-hydroxy-2-oxoheptanedioate aldolase